MAESSPLFGFDPTSTKVVGDYSKVAEAQGDIADAAAQSKSQQKPFDFLGIGKEVAQLGATFAEEKNALDAHQAKLRTMKFMQDNEHLSGHELSNKIENEIKGISEGDFSTGYREGALRVLDVGYNQALKRKEEERVASSLNVIQSDFSTQMSSNKANGIPMSETFAQEYATNTAAKFRVPVEYVRNAMVASYYEDAQMRVATATSKEDLAEAQKYILDSSKVLKSPLFLDSRSKKFQPVVDKLESDLKASVTAKQKEIRQGYALVLEQNRGDGKDPWTSYNTNPALMKDYYSDAYESPAAANKAYKADLLKFEEFSKGREILGTYNMYEPKPLIPNTDEVGGKIANEHIPKMVSAELIKQIANPLKFIELARYNTNALGDAGPDLLNIFETEKDPERLKQLKTAFENIRASEGGSQALQQVFGDDYKKVVGISVVSDMLYQGDVDKGRNAIYNASGVLVQGSLDKDALEKMYDIKPQLGELGDEFQYVLNVVSANTNRVDKKMVSRIADMFLEGIEEHDDVRFNFSKHNSTGSTVDGETFLKTVTRHASLMNFGGAKPMTITNHRNNIMSFTDEWGTPSGLIDATPILMATDALAIANEADDKKAIGYWSRVGDSYDVLGTYISAQLDGGAIFDGQKKMENAADAVIGLAAIWAQEDADRPKIMETILTAKTMFPDTISEEIEPDPLKRKFMLLRNEEARNFIDMVAEEFYGKSLETIMQLDAGEDPNLQIEGP